MSELIEANLWHEICQGNRRSFEAFYNTYARTLYDYGLKFTAKTTLIEDAIQELFIRIFEYNGSLNPKGNVLPYLFKSFRNNLFRMMAREDKYSNKEPEEYSFDVTFSIEHKIMANEQELQWKNQLVRGISKLTSRQKEVIFLRYTEGLSYNEISKILDLEIESCRNANCKAISVLRSEFKAAVLVLFAFLKKK